MLSLFSTENYEKHSILLLRNILDNQITVYPPRFFLLTLAASAFLKTSLNHHQISLLSLCRIPSSWFWLLGCWLLLSMRGIHLLWRCWSGWRGVSVLVTPEVCLPCCCVAEHIDGQEAGQASDRIQNLLGCYQSGVEFMAVKHFKVDDLAQSNQTVSGQLWANFLKTAEKLSKIWNRESLILKNQNTTLCMHTSIL